MPARGFTLIELAITMAVMAFLLFLGMPSISLWLQNTQIRTSAESVLNGLQTARKEAVSRNTTVRFYLVDPLDNTCARTTAGKSWVVSQGDPSAKCADPTTDDPTVSAALMIQKKSGAEATGSSVTVASAGSGSGFDYTLATFNGLGARTLNGDGSAPLYQVDVTSSVAGTRAMRVVVNLNGTVRMCDPQVSISGDPRACP